MAVAEIQIAKYRAARLDEFFIQIKIARIRVVAVIKNKPITMGILSLIKFTSILNDKDFSID
jgi:hypothetical protein